MSISDIRQDGKPIIPTRYGNGFWEVGMENQIPILI